MRGKTVALGDALVVYLRETGLEQSVLETRLVEQWGSIMGDTVARLTRSVEVKNGTLFVRISSAALKAQLFECRFELVAKLNTAMGAKVIRDVRILG